MSKARLFLQTHKFRLPLSAGQHAYASLAPFVRDFLFFKFMNNYYEKNNNY